MGSDSPCLLTVYSSSTISGVRRFGFDGVFVARWKGARSGVCV
jgi:hypothetical protein